MNHYTEEALDLITGLLVHRANEMGCKGFSFKEEAFTSYLALQPAGPLLWALSLHASALTAMTGLAKPNEVGALPFFTTENPEAPFHCEVLLQGSDMPMAKAMLFIDSALEHAIAIGIRSLGYSHSQWMNEVADESKIIPMEPYLADLQQNWANVAMESGDVRQQLTNWPVLADLSPEKTAAPSSSDNQGIGHSNLLNMTRR